LNDNLRDICFFQQFSADRIETGHPEGIRRQTAYVRSIDVKSVALASNAADKIDHTDRSRDARQDGWRVVIIDHDGNFSG
jgi:hypothetical protein